MHAMEMHLMAVGAQGAAPSGTYVETAAVGVREDLADIIYARSTAL